MFRENVNLEDPFVSEFDVLCVVKIFFTYFYVIFMSSFNLCFVPVNMYGYALIQDASDKTMDILFPTDLVDCDVEAP